MSQPPSPAEESARPEEYQWLKDRCPSCGCSLFVGKGGWITCSGLTCKTIGLDEMVATATQEATEDSFCHVHNLRCALCAECGKLLETQATEKERERCAQIAEIHWCKEARNCKDKIAQKIREAGR